MAITNGTATNNTMYKNAGVKKSAPNIFS